MSGREEEGWEFRNDGGSKGGRSQGGIGSGRERRESEGGREGGREEGREEGRWEGGRPERRAAARKRVPAVTDEPLYLCSYVSGQAK